MNNSVEAFEVRSGVIKLSLQKNAYSVIIKVEDNGKGIPEEVLKNIGQKGFSHGKEKSNSGSGLGVWHAKNYIESLGGKFEILSHVGYGTKVVIELPK